LFLQITTIELVAFLSFKIATQMLYSMSLSQHSTQLKFFLMQRVYLRFQAV